ncbi:hypothetical protein L6452_40786 [Arctium lappa]|uniref:Uncharacterized protein n=1 Tax=Arctium lappa TaxID=4217 RepID=A0ACB8XMW1_ARCLA|nr:hypothetical protein L6452_40786 [Arctium lappa]
MRKFNRQAKIHTKNTCEASSGGAIGTLFDLHLPSTVDRRFDRSHQNSEMDNCVKQTKTEEQEWSALAVQSLNLLHAGVVELEFDGKF